MHRPIVVVGSINLDLVAGTERIPQIGETVTGRSFNTFFGGKGANQAVAVAKLGYPVSIVGNVGSDAFGAQLRKGLEDAGVDSSCVNRVDGPSGIAVITTGAGGENSIIVVPGANGLLTPQLLEKSMAVLEGAAFILAQLEVPLETVEYLAEIAERHNIPLMLDPAPARELPRSLLHRVTWLTPNETETHELLRTNTNDGNHNPNAAADQLLACGVQNVALKLGAKGCMIAQKSLPREHVPAFAVAPVDTTAAGDAFNGGLAVGLLRGYSVTRSAVFACAVAAISVTRPGAQPSMPSADEVEQFLAKHEIEQPIKLS